MSKGVASYADSGVRGNLLTWCSARSQLAFIIVGTVSWRARKIRRDTPALLGLGIRIGRPTSRIGVAAEGWVHKRQPRLL